MNMLLFRDGFLRFPLRGPDDGPDDYDFLDSRDPYFQARMRMWALLVPACCGFWAIVLLLIRRVLAGRLLTG